VKLLFIGDIVGEPGRRAVKTLVPILKARHRLDLVIANGENAAGGSGITTAIAGELYDAGVHIITTGDHLWDQKDVVTLLRDEPRFVRPLNYPAGTPGSGVAYWPSKDKPDVAIVNLQGRTFMAPMDSPFLAVREEIERILQVTKRVFVDIHAEATSEKIAIGRLLDGKASAVVGTHTHVQTADEQIFPGGTAFLSDAGFTGPHESVLGRDIHPVLQRFLTNTPQRFTVASGRIHLQGAMIEIDDATGRALKIERVSEPLPGA
jgi:metallophosphoesterase (TIGR00282 family)